MRSRPSTPCTTSRRSARAWAVIQSVAAASLALSVARRASVSTRGGVVAALPPASELGDDLAHERLERAAAGIGQVRAHEVALAHDSAHGVRVGYHGADLSRPHDISGPSQLALKSMPLERSGTSKNPSADATPANATITA